jgi:hypothetical protein
MFGTMKMIQPSTTGQDPKTKMDEGINKLETELGFKIRDDFLAALGPEMLFTLNSIKFTMPLPIPTIDLALVAQTRDKAKVTKIMSQLEAYVNKKVASASGLSGQPGQGTTPPALMIQFQEIEHFGTKIRYLSMPQLPMYAPCYALDGSNLIVGLNLDGVKNLLDCKNGRIRSYTASEDFKVAQGYLPAPYNAYGFINIAAICDTVKNVVISQNPNYQQDKQMATLLAVINAIKAIQSIQSTSRGTADGIVSDSVILLK